jgi:glyoxylase-like metal-dependent hydrolase (beta-lactamase superfamily II)
MILGNFSIEQLSEGQFELYGDGSLVKKTAVSVSLNESFVRELLPELYQDIGIDPILVHHQGDLVMLDAGLGEGLDLKRENRNISNVRTNLEIFGYAPSDVNHVILSHLHHDHIAGLTYADEHASVRSTFANATIWVQRKEWEFALESVGKQNALSDIPYQLDDFYRLVADGQIRFLEDSHTQILPGLDVIRTGGHTPGHQIVRIRDNGKSAYYLGDLVPNENFLGFRMMRNADAEVTESRQIKMLLLKQAFHENAEILFYHSVHLKSGRLARDPERQFILRDS